MNMTKENRNLIPEQMPAKGVVNGTFFIAALVLLYVVILFYTQTVMLEDQEIAALGIALFVLSGVYTGRYLSFAWGYWYKIVPAWVFVLLVTTVTVCTIWLFVHAGSPFGNNYSMNLLLYTFPLLLLSVAAGMLIKLTRTSISNQLQSEKVQAAHSRSELNLLQSQLSPHFLFNTLNNMYGISITQSDKIPTLLLKLSDLLRYSVYDVKELFVPLKNEIAYLRNYIDFEKLRIGEKLVLNSAIEDINDENIKIAPMMLIVFLENAFKHSKNTAEIEVFIDVSLKMWGDSILFTVRNSYSRSTQQSNISRKDNGLGLANVYKRLELLYDKGYELNVQNEESIYSVRLQLKAK